MRHSILVFFILFFASHAYADSPYAKLFLSMAQKESYRNPDTRNASEDAVGYLQIRPVMVDDVNRILGHHEFDYSDRWDVDASYRMFVIFMDYYGSIYQRNTGNPPTDEIRARMWNGGPKGYAKKSTISYWRDVERIMDGN
jgi:hypothetical protein